MPVSCGSSRPPRLLIVDHGNSILNDCQDFLDNKGNGLQLTCTHVTGGSKGLSALKSHDFDIIFADLGSLDDIEADAEIALSKIAHYSQGALIIALSEGGSVTMAVAAMRAAPTTILRNQWQQRHYLNAWKSFRRATGKKISVFANTRRR